jgi:hypothetical protein
MRQALSNKNVEKLKKKTGLPIVKVMVRGGSHSKLLCLEDGSIMILHPDGTMEKDSFRWKFEEVN